MSADNDSLESIEPAAPNGGGDRDFHSFLEEYERETHDYSGPTEEPAPAMPAQASDRAPVEEAADTQQHGLARMDELATTDITKAIDELRKGRETDAARIDELARFKELALADFQSIERQRLHAIEVADFDALERRLSDGLKQFPNLPNDYVKRWLLAEAMQNPGLRNAWDNRGQNPAAWQYAEKTILKEFHKTASTPQIDMEATADRAAVADIVRRGGQVRAAESRPPNLGKMSNPDFNQYVQDTMGVHPGV